MKIFLTGDSDFAGGAIAWSFSRRYSIMALSRSEGSYAVLQSADAQPVRGDLENMAAAGVEIGEKSAPGWLVRLIADLTGPSSAFQIRKRRRQSRGLPPIS